MSHVLGMNKNLLFNKYSNKSAALIRGARIYGIVYLSIYLAFSLSGEGHCYRFPQLQQALLYRFVVEEVTVHNTGISLLLSTRVWVLLSPPVERRETRPTV